jgi:hypothetical protein
MSWNRSAWLVRPRHLKKVIEVSSGTRHKHDNDCIDNGILMCVSVASKLFFKTTDLKLEHNTHAHTGWRIATWRLVSQQDCVAVLLTRSPQYDAWINPPTPPHRLPAPCCVLQLHIIIFTYRRHYLLYSL